MRNTFVFITALWLFAPVSPLLTPAFAQEDQPIGVVALVNPDTILTRQAIQQIPEAGEDIFLDDGVTTDADGQVHLMLNDKSSFTVGPNSQITIDRFVYDPSTSSGEMAFNAVRGVMRFVGGELSKDQPVEIQTSLGTLGIRGGILLLEISQNGGMTAVFSFGTTLSFTSPSGVLQSVVVRPGYMIQVSPDGQVTGPEPANSEVVSGMLAQLEGQQRSTDDGTSSQRNAEVTQAALQAAEALLGQGVTGITQTQDGRLLFDIEETIVGLSEIGEEQIILAIEDAIEALLDVEVAIEAVEEFEEMLDFDMIADEIEDIVADISILVEIAYKDIPESPTADFWINANPGGLFDVEDDIGLDSFYGQLDLGDDPVEFIITTAGEFFVDNEGGDEGGSFSVSIPGEEGEPAVANGVSGRFIDIVVIEVEEDGSFELFESTLDRGEDFEDDDDDDVDVGT